MDSLSFRIQPVKLFNLLCCCMYWECPAFAQDRTAPAPFDQEQILRPRPFYLSRGNIVASLRLTTATITIPEGFFITPGQFIVLTFLADLPQPGDGFAFKSRVSVNKQGSKSFMTGWYPTEGALNKARAMLPSLSACDGNFLATTFNMQIRAHVNHRLDRQSDLFLKLIHIKIPPVNLLPCEEERKKEA